MVHVIKVFVINACRGRMEEPVGAVGPGNGVGVDAAPEVDPAAALTPPDADTFIWLSTQQGYVSYNSEEKGSHFLRILAKVHFSPFLAFP